MNNKTLIELCQNHSEITMNIDDFTELLKADPVIINITTDRQALQSGLYGTFCETKLFISRHIKPGQLKLTLKMVNKN